MALELDERITRELRELYRSSVNDGKLLSGEQLAGYYSTFRSRFGPDRLKNLDGEALLNTMHDMQNRDSLVYWLEFKDDEEFPSPRFGSIAGGSAFKFGLFRRKKLASGLLVLHKARNNSPFNRCTTYLVWCMRGRHTLLIATGALERRHLWIKKTLGDWRDLSEKIVQWEG